MVAGWEIQGGKLTLLVAFTTLQGTRRALMILFLRVNFSAGFNTRGFFFWLSTYFSPTFIFLKLLVIKVFVCKQEHFPVTVHLGLPVWMRRDRWNPVGDIIIIPTIAHYKLNNKHWRISALVSFCFTMWVWMTRQHLGGGSRDAVEQPWKNIPSMSSRAHPINFNMFS